MDVLKCKKANTFHGGNTKGWILAWESEETRLSSLFNEVIPVYQSVQSWPIYSSKSQAQDTISLVIMLALLLPQPYHVNMWNIYPEAEIWSNLFKNIA
jgi:hypothetical protein